MRVTTLLIVTMMTGMAVAPVQATADEKVETILTNMTHVQRWNRFADKVLELHKSVISKHKIRTTEKLGGYYRQPDFYKDVHYYDADTGRLLSRVLWETKHPNVVHYMEVYRYDKKGRIDLDFDVGFLTDGRNAPVQTLINFHHYSGDLHAFRQFDASNNRIFEHCDGKYNGKDVNVDLSEMDLIDLEEKPDGFLSSKLYKECFGDLPKTAGKYLTPQF